MKQDSHKPYLVMVLSQDLSSPSGLGRYFPLAKYLVRANYRVTILALHSNFESEKKRDFWDQGVHIRYVSQMHVRKNENKTEYFSTVDLIKVSITATKALLREAMQENPDLVFVGKPHPMNGIAGLMVAHRKSIPLIVDCDDYEAESNKTSSRWQKILLRFFENSLPKKANLVTTNTYFNKERMQKLGIASEKIHYLPNGVDTERFQSVSAGRLNNLRHRLGLGDNKVVAYLGSLNLANHPVDLLIRSFAKVVKNQEGVSLLIVGGGGDMEKLQELVKELKIKESVVFTGRVQPDEINAYYQLADVSVDPVNDTLADRGRCPLKLFESWQMGVPVVTSDVGDGPERKRAEAFVDSNNLSKVSFKDWIPQHELVKEISKADVSLGAFGDRPQSLLTVHNKVYECMAMGKAVLVARTPAIEAQFSDEVELKMCERTGESIAETILYLRENPEVIERIGFNARQSFVANYSIDALGRTFRSHLESLL